MPVTSAPRSMSARQAPGAPYVSDEPEANDPIFLQDDFSQAAAAPRAEFLVAAHLARRNQRDAEVTEAVHDLRPFVDSVTVPFGTAASDESRPSLSWGGKRLYHGSEAVYVSTRQSGGGAD